MKQITITPSHKLNLQEQIDAAQSIGINRILLKGTFRPGKDSQFSLLNVSKPLELIGVDDVTVDGQKRVSHLVFVEDGATFRATNIHFIRGNTNVCSSLKPNRTTDVKRLNIFRYVDGGAISLGSGSKVKLHNCVFQDNHAVICGGAISNLGGFIEINNCQFINNTSGDTGAAIDNLASGSLAVIRNSSFVRNTSNCLGSGTHGAISAFPRTYLYVVNSDFLKENGIAIDYIQNALGKTTIVVIKDCKFDKHKTQSVIVNPQKNLLAGAEIVRQFFKLFLRNPTCVKFERIPSTVKVVWGQNKRTFFSLIGSKISTSIDD